MPRDLVFDLSASQASFVSCAAHIAQLVGGMGEGKTYAGVAGIMHHAHRCAAGLKGESLRGALIRDTHQNIKISTVESVQEILGDWVVFKDDYKKMYIKPTRVSPAIDFDLFGIDDPASISKLQGPGYGMIWLEEPAPIHERANSGLPKEVFLMAIARCGRQKGTIPRLQITHNPGDAAHWTTELIDDPREYMVADDGAVIVKETFRIKKGENKYLTSLQRALNQAAFKGDKGKWARYVEGNVATVDEGKPVVSSYGEQTHFSQQILPIYPNMPGIRAWDGYGHPCCITMQFNPAGQLVIHDVLYDEGCGVEDLIEDKLLPLLATPKYAGKISSWRDIGDPSMATMDQSSRKRSAAKVINAMLQTHFESGPTRWNNRIEPTNHALQRGVSGGKPLVFLSASAKILNRALRGGWHYRVNNSGSIIGRDAVKNEFSHPGDAFSYAVAKLLPYDVRKQLTKRNREAEMQRISSYATNTGFRAARHAEVF